MAGILTAPGIAFLELFKTPTRMIVLAVLFNALFALVLGLLVTSGRAWTHPAILLAIAICVFANYQHFCHYLVVKEGFGELANAIKRLAAGELAQHGSGGAVGELKVLVERLDGVGSRLASMFAEVHAGSEAIGRDANEVADGHARLAQRTDEQVATLEQSAAGMHKLSETVRRNAESCARADELARHSEAVATRGAQTVNRAVERMAQMEESSGRVVDIIAVIEGIAFQTNILALNAAVEAARAGEEGRGFAVVASEVRSLAQRSADAAREVRALIEDSATNVAEGGKLVAEAGTIINEIVIAVRDVTQLIAEVARASREQSHGVEEVRRAVAQMEGVTRQDSALVEKASAASEAFEEASRRLSEAVGKFRVN
jgi:methyl-accepting chemotaxis protein